MKHQLLNEIATRSQSIDYWALGYYLPNPDPVLKKMGKDISVYRELLSDPHLGGCVRRRKASIKGLQWRLTTTNNTKVDKILAQVFEHLALNTIMTEMLDAMLFGYQVMEVMWEQRDGLLLPTKIIGKPQEWFVFDDENHLRFRTKENWMNGELLPERKFLLLTQEASYTNPYGMGDLSKCFWATTFKKGGFKFWLEFTEKYGSPFFVGKHHRTASEQEKECLLDSLEEMIGTAVTAIPNDASIEIMEASGKSASSDVYDRFLKYCKAEIAIAILGQNQTTEAEANRASSQAGLEVTKDLRHDDAQMVQSAFNQLLRWICELNFHVEQLPKFELFEQESIDKMQAERDVLLSQMGVQFTEQYLNRVYNFEQGDIVLAQNQQMTEKAEFAEHHQNQTRRKKYYATELLLNRLGKQAEPLFDEQVQRIQVELANCTDLVEFQEKLDEMIGELDYQQYAKLLADGMTTAHLMGRYDVTQESQK